MKTMELLLGVRIGLAVILVSLMAGAEAGSAASVQLFSTRSPGRLLPAGGNGHSVAPVVTPDGRFVLFASQASDLVTNGNSRFVKPVEPETRMQVWWDKVAQPRFEPSTS